jgi:hypothetical protein
VGSFLRAFGFGHARQLDAVTREHLARAVAAGAYPGFGESMTVDIDSTGVRPTGSARTAPAR